MARYINLEDLGMSECPMRPNTVEEVDPANNVIHKSVVGFGPCIGPACMKWEWQPAGRGHHGDWMEESDTTGCCGL